MDILKIVEQVKEAIEGHRWRLILFKTYPTKKNFTEALAKRLEDSAAAIIVSAGEGYKKGHNEGYAAGYTDGFNECLKLASEEFRQQFEKEMGDKRIRMVQ